MSKKTAHTAKKLVEDKLKDTEDRLDEILRKLRNRANDSSDSAPVPEQYASHA